MHHHGTATSGDIGHLLKSDAQARPDAAARLSVSSTGAGGLFGFDRRIEVGNQRICVLDMAAETGVNACVQQPPAVRKETPPRP